MPTIRVNDINMYYEQSGSGPDLVFISGLGVDHSIWNLDYFNNFRVLVFDNRGAGRTETPKGPYSMLQLTEDMIALCQALQIEKAHFVGHSMGGHIVQYIAAKYPEMVNKAVIACSEQHFSIISHLATKQQMALRQYQLPQRLLIEDYLPVLFSSTFLEDSKRLEEFIQTTLNYQYPQTNAGYIAQVEALRQHDTTGLLTQIKCECLILACTNDLLTPPENSEYLKNHITNAKLEIIKNSGHVPYIEKAEEFYNVICKFLN